MSLRIALIKRTEKLQTTERGPITDHDRPIVEIIRRCSMIEKLVMNMSSQSKILPRRSRNFGGFLRDVPVNRLSISYLSTLDETSRLVFSFYCE